VEVRATAAAAVPARSACALLARQGRQSTWIDLSSWAVSFFRLVVPIAAVPSDAAAHCLAICRLLPG
jgi:hypothetical protein